MNFVGRRRRRGGVPPTPAGRSVASPRPPPAERQHPRAQGSAPGPRGARRIGMNGSPARSGRGGERAWRRRAGPGASLAAAAKLRARVRAEFGLYNQLIGARPAAHMP